MTKLLFTLLAGLTLLKASFSMSMKRAYEAISSQQPSSLQRDSYQRALSNRLFEAIDNGNLVEVKHLLSLGVNLEIRDDRGNTPLLAAAAFQRDIANELLNRGADPNAKNAFGATALHLAAVQFSIDLVKELINKGANVNIRDNENQTALMRVKQRLGSDLYWATGMNYRMKWLLFFLKNHEKLNNVKYYLAENKIDKDKALEYAVKDGNYELVEYLLNIYLYNKNKLKELLTVAKDSYSSAKQRYSSRPESYFIDPLLDNYRKIGRIINEHIGILRQLTRSGDLEGSRFEVLPDELIEEISRHIRQRN